MKKLLFAIFPVAMLTMGVNLLNEPLPIGSPVPNAEIKMKDISGKEVALKDVKTNKGLLVMFSCNTCPYVVKNQQRTNEVCKYALDNGIGVAVINSNEAYRGSEDSFEAMKSYAKNQGYNWNYLVDKNSAMADAFGASRTPECFLFDKNSELVYHGAIDDNPSDASSVSRKHLITAMEETKAGKEVSVKQSRSVGCGIKRIK